jgi:predicted GNAT family acetyltransferase
MLLKNALKGNDDCRLYTSELRYNFEYLDFLKELNRIYESYKGSDYLLNITTGDSSSTIVIESEAYLLEYDGNEFNSKMDKTEIENNLKKKGIENYTAEFIALSIVEEKPIDLVYIIKYFIASLGQSYIIDIVDMAGNEEVFKINY